MRLFFLAFLLPFIELSCGETVDEVDRLMTDLFRNYNNKIRPPHDQRRTLDVYSSFFLRGINDFDSAAGVLRGVGGLWMTWEDYRLAWNVSDYSNITEIEVPRSDIWFPQIAIVNSAEKVEPLGNDIITVLIRSNGTVIYRFGDNLNVICEVDMTFFPFDTQTREIFIGLWNHLRGNVILRSVLGAVDLQNYVRGSVWDISETKVSEYNRGDIVGVIRTEISIQRKPSYFVFGMLAPIVILTILNPFVFLLHIDSGERNSFSVTLFLSFAVFLSLVNEHMPESSEPLSALSYYVFVALVYSAKITLANILCVSLHYQEETAAVSHWAKLVLVVLSLGFYWKEIRKDKRGKVIDSPRSNDEIPQNNNSPRCNGQIPHNNGPLSFRRLADMYDKTFFVYSMFVLFLMVLSLFLLYSFAP